jgi:putative hydrolase of the HAD superfamily
VVLEDAADLGWVLFDWGGTLMIDFPEYSGPMASWPRVEAVAHAHETLERLRAMGWRTALATNAADSDEPEIRAALARVGLDQSIDRVYCSRGVGHSKPSQEFFAFIMRDLGLDAGDLVMVGDSFANDIQGANRAGIRGLWLHPGGAGMPAGEQWRVIESLAQVPGMVGIHPAQR